jgi:hypothetical protein
MRCSRSVRVDVSEIAAAKCQAGYRLLLRYERPAGLLGAWCLSLDASGNPRPISNLGSSEQDHAVGTALTVCDGTNASALTRDERVAVYHSRNQNCRAIAIPAQHQRLNTVHGFRETFLHKAIEGRILHTKHHNGSPSSILARPLGRAEERGLHRPGEQQSSAEEAGRLHPVICCRQCLHIPVCCYGSIVMAQDLTQLQ